MSETFIWPGQNYFLRNHAVNYAFTVIARTKLTIRLKNFHFDLQAGASLISLDHLKYSWTMYRIRLLVAGKEKEPAA